ncbi:MAG: hypothetical protein R6U20_07155 [Longimonas sp.]|uniref:hypothetical protein n=1 Tax=Longimonas sp. TaxID=2039626 RepID=UPI0039762F9C
MPNATAKALEQRLLRSFPPNQPYVPDDWRTAAVPSVVQSFLLHRLLEKLDEVVHNMRQEEMAWVNDSDPELESARAAFEDALRDNGQIPESNWAQMVRQASHIGISYLVRPVPTATAYLFEGRDTTLSVAYIAYRMQALAPYEYLRQGLDAFARHRDVQRLNAKTFRETLTKVDRLLTQDYSVDRWVDTLAPLFEAAEAAYGDPGCPVRVLHPFFAHKEQTVYADRLRTLDDDRMLTEAELRAVLIGSPVSASPNTSASSAPAQPTESAPDASEDSSSDASEEAPDHPWGDRASRTETAPTSNTDAPTETASPKDDSTPYESTWGVPSQPRPVEAEENKASADASSSSAENEEATPLWKQFHASKNTSKAPESAPSEGGTARWQQFKSGGSNQSANASPSGSPGTDRVQSLEAAVFGQPDAERRSLFLRQLFNNSSEHYAEVLGKLQQAASWNEASQIIAQDVFRRNKINIYSDAAVNFTNAVERNYR